MAMKGAVMMTGLHLRGLIITDPSTSSTTSGKPWTGAVRAGSSNKEEGGVRG